MNRWWHQVGSFVAIAALACAVALACGDSDAPQPGPTPDLAATLVAFPTPAPTATPAYEGSLQVGAWARVTGAGDCLNFRVGAGTEGYSPINFCKPDGFEGYVSDGPMLNEGQWWWWIAGQGWAQDDYLEFVRSENLSTRTVPELSGLGQIAYIGADGDLWLMNTDGTDRRNLVEAPPASSSTYIGSPQWRSDGQQLLYSAITYHPNTTTYEVRIVDLKGDLIKVVSNATSAFWSSDGTRLGVLHGIVRNEVGSIEATPSVFDIATGELTPIGPLAFYGEGPKWRPGADELAYTSRDGLTLVEADGSGSRVLLPTRDRGASYVPNWSPDGRRLSANGTSGDCLGYFVIDASSGAVVVCAPVRPGDQNRGGRGGTAEDRQTDWSPNGRLFAYHTEWGVVNESGVYIVDATTGEQTLLPCWRPSFVSFAPDSLRVSFETWGNGPSFIWVGDATTGDVTLLAEGSQPAWRPVARRKSPTAFAQLFDRWRRTI